MKRILSCLLIFVTVFCLTACGEKAEEGPSDNVLLPYGLEFGMSYDQAQEICEGFPSISKADSNEGYASEKFKPSIDDYYAMFGINSDTLYEEMNNGFAVVFDPGYYFSFNTDKELYEFSAIMQIFNGERTAEYVFNTYLDYFSEKLGAEADMKETDTELAGTIETDTQKVSVVMETDESTFTVYFVVHSTEYDLNS